jgi:hypothetical protein
LPRWLYGAKDLQQVAKAEIAGILPANQFGARPGRSTTDALHKVVKDARRDRKVATVLCMDVKGAFPSVDLNCLYHDLWMRSVPVQHTDWLQRSYAARKGHLTFGDFTSDPFDITGGLDQGDPHSGFLYGIYNAALAEIPQPAQGEDGVVFVDDNTIIAVASTFPQTHAKIQCMIERPGGINDWGASHNAIFGPAKYQVAGFSQRRVPHPFLRNKTIPEPRYNLWLRQHTTKTMPSVKLLGVHLDRELHWHQQEAAALAKGEAWLIQTARIARGSRGIVASDMRRLYLGVCVPHMLYATDLFLSPPASNRSLLATLVPEERKECAIVKKLRSVQRRAALAITGALRSTPTDVLDVYVHLLPVRYLIDKVRAGAALRLVTRPPTNPMHTAVREEAARSSLDAHTCDPAVRPHPGLPPRADQDGDDTSRSRSRHVGLDDGCEDSSVGGRSGRGGGQYFNFSCIY